MSIEEQTPAEHEAAEELAFAEAFNSERGEAEPAETATEEAPPAEEEVAPADEVAPAEAEPVVAGRPVIAGLTEEQVTQALARVSQQQNTIDKLGGRIGQLMQQVEALKSKPSTVGERQQFNLKLEKLGNAFPELAELLREDFKELTPGEAVPAQAAPPSFTAEDVDAIVNQKLTQFQVQQELGFEVKALGITHPDWEQVIRTPQFALWRDNVIPDGKELMESENAQFISVRLTQFKDWVKNTTVTPPSPQVTTQPVQQRQQNQRLANAVIPRGQAPAKVTELSEEDAFMSAFKKERTKSGH